MKKTDQYRVREIITPTCKTYIVEQYDPGRRLWLDALGQAFYTLDAAIAWRNHLNRKNTKA